MKSYRLLFSAVAILILVPLNPSFAATPVRTVARYKVSSRGFTIGDVLTTQQVSEEGGKNRIHFETKTSVKASLLWIGYQLSSTEKGVLQNGTLVSYSRKGQENGVTIDVEGRLENASFRFDVLEHGVSRSVVIPRSSYDYTTMECPEARVDFSIKPQVTLRILDVEKLTVVKRDYHLVRNANYSVTGIEYPCRIVDFSDQNKKARRWIKPDEAGAIIMRQDGTGMNGSYSVRLANLKSTP